VLVKVLSGSVYEVKLDLETDTFEKIAKFIEEKVGIPPAKLRLTHRGKLCPLEAKLKDHNVKERDTIALVIQLK